MQTYVGFPRSNTVDILLISHMQSTYNLYYGFQPKSAER
jgi:hypothetical protein